MGKLLYFCDSLVLLKNLNLKDCPRAESCEILGRAKFTRSQEDVFPNASRLEAVYGHSLSISREVLIFENVCMVPICIIAGTLSM